MTNNWKVTQHGKELDASKYTWNNKTKTFTTTEDNLVLNFSEIDGVTFNTGSNCTFKTGSDCTFDTGSYCIFKTGWSCTFKTGWSCTFKTGWSCTFDTGSYCIFKTGKDCVCVRKDIFEFFEIPKDKKIKLNGYREKGYTEVK